MRECSYELYVAIYQAVRHGMASGDDDIVRRVSMHLAERDSVTSLVMTLAVIDAKRRDPERTKENICRDVFCNRSCSAWGGGGGGRGQRGTGGR